MGSIRESSDAVEAKAAPALPEGVAVPGTTQLEDEEESMRSEAVNVHCSAVSIDVNFSVAVMLFETFNSSVSV